MQISVFTSSEPAFLVNSVIIETQNGIIVVDAQFLVSEAQKLKQQIEQLGKPLLAVIITHPHPDHLHNRKEFIQEVVKPLQDKIETVYVIPGSDAEAHAAKRFPHKQIKRVRNSLTPISIAGFKYGLSLVFQPNQAKGLNTTYHFLFTGQEFSQFTVIVSNQSCEVHEGLVDRPNLVVKADSKTWIGFLRKERNIVLAILTRKIRVKGDIRLLLKFARCFPT